VQLRSLSVWQDDIDQQNRASMGVQHLAAPHGVQCEAIRPAFRQTPFSQKPGKSVKRRASGQKQTKEDTPSKAIA